jgi:hypothetical protein
VLLNGRDGQKCPTQQWICLNVAGFSSVVGGREPSVRISEDFLMGRLVTCSDEGREQKNAFTVLHMAYISEAFSYVGIRVWVLSEFKALLRYKGQSESVTICEMSPFQFCFTNF